MQRRSLSRRSVLRATGSTALVGLAGCTGPTDGNLDANALYILNETPTRQIVTLHYLECDNVSRDEQSLEVSVDSYTYSANSVVSDSGPCTLEVSTLSGLSKTYTWNVGRQTLTITVTSDGIEFDHRPRSYDP